MGYGAVLRAVGVFTFPGVVFFVIYYPFALPAALVLMEFARWGLLGYWVPFSLAAVLQTVPLVVYLAFTDWTRLVAQQNQNLESDNKISQDPDESQNLEPNGLSISNFTSNIQVVETAAAVRSLLRRNAFLCSPKRVTSAHLLNNAR